MRRALLEEILKMLNRMIFQQLNKGPAKSLTPNSLITNLLLRQFLDESHQTGVIQVAVAHAFHRRHHLADNAGNHKRHAEFRAGRQGDLQVFFVQPDAEARFEIPIQHFLAMRFEDFRLGKTAEQRLSYFRGIDAGFGREHQGFADDGYRRADDHLIRRFGELSRAGVADMDNIFTELLKNRHGTFDC